MESTPVHGVAYGHLAKPHAVAAFTTLVLFGVLATIAVVLRFYARHLLRGAYFAHDWMVLTALIIFYGYVVSAFTSLFIGGTGWQITQLGSAEIENALKIDLVLEVTYAASMGLLKVSICIMLRSIFPTRNVRIFALVALVLSICWSIMTILVGFLLCAPLSFNWDPDVPGGHCGNQNAAYSSVSAIDIFIDLIIIIIPLPAVWKMHVPNITKLALSGIFGLGIFTIIITAVRLHTLLTVDFSDFSYSSTSIFLWTTVEWGTAIMVTCGPTLRPLLEKWFPNSAFRRRDTEMKDNMNSDSSGQKILSGRKGPKRNDFDRIDDDDDAIALEPQGKTHAQIIVGDNSSKTTGKPDSEVGFTSENGWGQKGITVESEWDVERG